MKAEPRYEMNPANTAEAIAMAEASTPLCRFGCIEQTEGDVRRMLDAGIGEDVWMTWTPDPFGTDNSLAVAVTGNGPTSEANAKFFAHARDIVIALGREVIALRSHRDKSLEALIWCSGSADFGPGGQAREGWLKLCAPLIHGKKAPPHNFKFMSSHGSDEPGKSLDIYEQCPRCGLVRHDYRHNGGQTSPNFPMYLVEGVHCFTAPPCLLEGDG